MNIQRQTNSVDSGLYAVAMLASLLLGQDPMIIAYNPEELHVCLHLTKVLEEKKNFFISNNKNAKTCYKNCLR